MKRKESRINKEEDKFNRICDKHDERIMQIASKTIKYCEIIKNEIKQIRINLKTQKKNLRDIGMYTSLGNKYIFDLPSKLNRRVLNA